MEINGTITLNEHTEISFRLTEDGGWQQWGGTPAELGLTRDLVSDLSTAFRQNSDSLGEDS